MLNITLQWSEFIKSASLIAIPFAVSTMLLATPTPTPSTNEQLALSYFNRAGDDCQPTQLFDLL